MIHKIEGVEIIGQERIKRAAVTLKSTQSPILILGALGSGKTTVGKYLSSRIACQGDSEVLPCGECGCQESFLFRDDIHRDSEERQVSYINQKIVLATSYPRRIIPELTSRCQILHLQRYDDEELRDIYRNMGIRFCVQTEEKLLNSLIQSCGQNLARAETVIRNPSCESPPDIPQILRGLERETSEQILERLLSLGGEVSPSYLWEEVRNFLMEEEVSRLTGRAIPRLPDFQAAIPEVVDWLAMCPFQNIEDGATLRVALLRLLEKLKPQNKAETWNSPYAMPRRIRKPLIPEGRALSTEEVAASIRGGKK